MQEDHETKRNDHTLAPSIDRRQWLQLCSVLGALAVAPGISAQSPTIDLEMLGRANRLLDTPMDDTVLQTILPAVQRNWDFFRIVRDTQIDDSIEPAPMFHARGSGL